MKITNTYTKLTTQSLLTLNPPPPDPPPTSPLFLVVRNTLPLIRNLILRYIESILMFYMLYLHYLGAMI